MILKSPTSRLSIVNLFADFILNKIPKNEQSIIQVVDCINFYVIKGKTTYKEPLNILKLKDEFITKFEGMKLMATIDLIEYDSNITTLNKLTFEYHNTENCSYNETQIKSFKQDNEISYDYKYFLKPVTEDNSLFFQSEFPHGHSLSQGRLLYYYGKHIFYNIPPSYPVSTLVFEMSTNKGESGDNLFLVKNTNNEINEVLTSSILDMFDFDMSSLENEIKKVDWSIEVTNPLEDYDFLKKKIKDFIIF